jgi:acyl-CoA synthetase (AMP-forming)/AMP-acid ligase II
LCYVANRDVEQSTLEALAKRNLARYKQPRIYHPCDTLPSSANGKLLRRVLRAEIEAHYG